MGLGQVPDTFFKKIKIFQNCIDITHFLKNGKKYKKIIQKNYKNIDSPLWKSSKKTRFFQPVKKISKMKSASRSIKNSDKITKFPVFPKVSKNWPKKSSKGTPLLLLKNGPEVKNGLLFQKSRVFSKTPIKRPLIFSKFFEIFEKNGPKNGDFCLKSQRFFKSHFFILKKTKKMKNSCSASMLQIRGWPAPDPLFPRKIRIFPGQAEWRFFPKMAKNWPFLDKTEKTGPKKWHFWSKCHFLGYPDPKIPVFDHLFGTPFWTKSPPIPH